jgi:hypothetical protein
MTSPEYNHDRMPMYAGVMVAGALLFLFLINRAFVRVSV